MASKTYKAQVLVLKKTKIKEKDLVITMLDSSGRLVQGVAKGARKPGGSFAARLELFSEAQVLMAEGRSLDVVCDAKLVNPAQGIARGLEQSACAAPLAEVLCNIAQPDLDQPRVFDISQAAFALMGDVSLSPKDYLALCAASLWKVMSQIGFRPSLSTCVMCGSACASVNEGGQAALSVADGGIVCDDCMRPADAIVVSANTLRWCEAFIRMRFNAIIETPVDVATLIDVLQIARMWARVHTGRNVKSLDFLFTSGLFS